MPKAKTKTAGAPEHELISDHDIYLFNEGTHTRLYNHLGAHRTTRGGETGVNFAVWAPNAERVSVVGDFNHWTPGEHPMTPVAHSGIWRAFVPGLGEGDTYKYHIASRVNGYEVQKADPFGFMHEVPPKTASRVASLDYQWNDSEWMSSRAGKSGLDAPVSIYELHLGSWIRSPDNPEGMVGYRELAEKLPAYLREHRFTHVEFLPVMEHPFYESWGYQTTGYFAPSSRYGSPADFMHLIDKLHQAGIAVILDWVPSHFPSDEHGPGYFDGTHLYEHEDPRLGFHPDWKSLIFNYGRHEVRSFLLSSALFWLDKYHIDGLRVDAVASMLYLNYSRNEGEWLPNRFGGNENLEAVDFLKRLNTEVFGAFPDAQTFAEESTAWPGVSRPVYDGGLGFGYKWDMGWMHDTLAYYQRDPVYRTHHHGELTFRGVYMFTENFTLPLSHDEVVHGKGSLLEKMPGDDWQRFANNRLLLANQWTQPGKKLLFMGAEFAQRAEWNNNRSLDWHLLDHPPHRGMQRLVTQLNRVYTECPALHQLDCEPAGFRWLEANNADESIVAFMRCSRTPGEEIIVVLNNTPMVRHDLHIGAPKHGRYREILNTDAEEFCGSGVGNMGVVETHPIPAHGMPARLTLTAPPLAAVLLCHEDAAPA
jgi:1,4-alpha-glucan branching enzyme